MTELVFILDRSGSMSGLEADTIGGFNSMLAQQKREAGEALVSTVFFANDSTVIHDRLPLSEVPPLTEKEYFTRGCTALLDAVGGAIHHIGNIHKYAQPGTRVYLTCEAGENQVTITFRNISATPLNISADELTERFVRGDSSRSTEGSGLGLSIATSLTAIQGGDFRLTIDGDLFKVTLTLPRAEQKEKQQ